MPAIEMPYPFPGNQVSFDPTFVQLISPVGGGFLQTINRQQPLWTAKYNTPPLSDSRYQSVQAFLDSLSGAQYTFLAYDLRRPMPFAYKFLGLGATPWQSTTSGAPAPIVGNTDPATNQIFLNQLQPGFVITSGDYISFQDNNIWYLFRSTITAVTNILGSMALTVNMTPPTLAHVSNPSIPFPNVRFARACAEMKVIGGVQKSDQVSDIGPTYSFSAVQYISRNGT